MEPDDEADAREAPGARAKLEVDTPTAPADPRSETVPLTPTGPAHARRGRRGRDTDPRRRYTLGAVIGRGGMGEVVSARDEQIGRPVAIKRMRSEAPSPEAVSRFLREARVQGRLEHPAVVPVHELWHDDRGNPFFVMKQLSGVTLAEVLSRLAAGDTVVITQFPRQRLLRAFADVCLAIEFAHTRGVVHRDLKPANIMVGDFGEVYVLDWGIARVDGDDASSPLADIEAAEIAATVAGSVLGTPGYMAPEQRRGDTDLDGRIDVYALGSVLFEILALQAAHPHEPDTGSSATAEAECRPSARSPERDIPPELDAICTTAMRADRADRYATPRALGDAVQRYLDGDRDLALRKQLARTELAHARTALAAGDGPDQRRLAIGAAARALALDPTDREPADLVGRLMLDPPTEVPGEVVLALDEIDGDAMHATRPLLIVTSIVLLGFFPVMYWVGFRDPVLFVVGVASTLTIGLTAALGSRRHVMLVGYCSMFGHALLIGLFARFFTPFLIAPAFAIVTAMAISTHPRIARGWFVFALYSTAVLGPWALELAGVLRRTTFIAGDTVSFRVPVNDIDPIAAMIALVLYVLAALTLAVFLARRLTNDRRAAQRTVQIQAWQLAQLVRSSEPASRS